MKSGLGVTLAAAVVTVSVFAGAAVPASAADVDAGRKKAATQCAVCHGTNGMAQLPEAPNLAGQVEMYLVKALGDYRSGARTNEMMTIVSKDLSDADIENLAAWYASIKIEVTPP